MQNYKQKNLRVLIVDDAIVNQEIARDFMEDLGFSVDTVDNGLQAIEAVNHNTYSLICMDVQMPVMNGFDATKAIREYEIIHNIKPVAIIALTSETKNSVEQNCLDAGMNDFLPKPFTHEQIIQKISYWLDDGSTQYQQDISNTPAIGNYAQYTLHNECKDVSQLSHWFWHFSENRLEFSSDLQAHFKFPLNNIKTLNEFIISIDGNHLIVLVNKCINTGLDTKWEQLIREPGMEQPKYLLHRFRIIHDENDNFILIGTVQDITYIRRVEQQIVELASHDPVTGLSSKFKFKLQLEDLIKHAQRRSEKFVVLYLNLGIFNRLSTLR